MIPTAEAGEPDQRVRRAAVVALDYPTRIAQFSDALLDKQQIARELDDVSFRHVERVNVLFADKSVRTLGLTEAKPTMNQDPWTP